MGMGMKKWQCNGDVEQKILTAGRIEDRGCSAMHYKAYAIDSVYTHKNVTFQLSYINIR